MHERIDLGREAGVLIVFHQVLSLRQTPAKIFHTLEFWSLLWIL